MKKGWESKELKAVSAINYGYTESASADPVGPRFLRITDIQNDCVDWENVPYCKIEKEDLRKYCLERGDIVFARTGATTGKSFLVCDPPKDTVFASYLIRLRLLDKELLPDFVSLFFQTAGYWQTIKEGSSGSAQGGFNATKLGALSIPFPPLPEQQRIVGILDEAFAGIATAKANAEKNLQNARALFESYLQAVFSQQGEGWVDRQLLSLCHEITVGHVGPMKTEYKESGIPFLRSQNIRPFEVSMDNAMLIDEVFHRALKKSQLRPGDLAIVRTGYPGTAAVIPPELPDSNCSDLVIVRPNEEVNPHFLAAFFNSAFGKQLVLGKIVGAAQKHFNITAAKEVMLHVPPITEQKKIIRVVNSLRAEIQRLESIYRRKLTALDELKKSMLHQAFAGKL